MNHGGLKGWQGDCRSAEGGEGGGEVVMMPDAEEDASIYRPEPDRKHLGLTAASI